MEWGGGKDNLSPIKRVFFNNLVASDGAINFLISNRYTRIMSTQSNILYLFIIPQNVHRRQSRASPNSVSCDWDVTNYTFLDVICGDHVIQSAEISSCSLSADC